MREKTVEEYMEEMRRMMKRRVELPSDAVAVVTEPEREVEPISEPEPVPDTIILPEDGMGSLIVVVNSAESRPLSGARIEISRPETGEVLYTLTTDESGKTDVVELPAPLRDYSLSPGQGEIVYGLYNISASADGYVTSVLYNIPVFDSVVSIQQMRLLWLPASGGRGEQNDNEENPYTLQ